MSSTLDSIIRRRKRECEKSNSSTKSKSSAPQSENCSWFKSSWVIVAVILVIVLILGVIYWYFWRTPAVKTTPSILEEMKNMHPDSKRTVETPGVVSLATFREFNSRFSRNYTDTSLDAS